MNLQTLWRRITATHYSRELEREVLRERAEAVRLRDELAREQAENSRLRTENRALLNSILGIAGIPPVLVDHSAVDAIVPSRAVEMGRSSDPAAANVTALEGAHMDRDLIPTNPDRPCSPRPRMGDGSDDFKREELSEHAARENAAHLIGASGLPAHASASAEIKSSAAEHPTSKRTSAQASSATHRPIFSRARSPRMKSVFDKQPIGTPTRRRSWHQINRQLELESARRPVTSDE